MLVERATVSQGYQLPSSYPSSIASSWSRPERSVWFQSKAIIITSIFLAIFIVLFIGAAVFLRDRKDDEFLEESDEAQFEWMKSERVQAGLAVDGSSGDQENEGGRAGGQGRGGERESKTKRRKDKVKKAFGLGRSKEKDGAAEGGDPASTVDREPSSGSSTAVRRGRYLAARWARVPTRKKAGDSRETFVGSSDTASIRSSRSNRRPALGPPATSDRVEITYDDRHSDDRSAGTLAGTTQSDVRSRAGRSASSASSAERRADPDAHSLRPPPTPPPHSDAALVQQPAGPRQSRDSASGVAPSPGPANRVLDQDDFAAVDEAEAVADDDRRAQQLPPAYISSGPAASSQPPTSGAMGVSRASGAEAMEAALSRGDLKRGLPPPEHRDPNLPAEVLGMVLRDLEEEQAALDRLAEAQGLPASANTAHIAVDDKETLSALYAAASRPAAMPGHTYSSGLGQAPAEEEGGSAPAYASGAVVTAEAGSSAPPALAPSAPQVDVDHDGFEVVDEDGAGQIREPLAPPPPLPMPSTPMGKGKGKLDTGLGSGATEAGLGLLPAPPKPVDTAFSPFDQPYRPLGPPNPSAPPSPLPGTPRTSQSRSRSQTSLPMSSPSSRPRSSSGQEPSGATAELGPPGPDAKGKQPVEGASSAAAQSAKQQEAEAELAQYIASAPADLVGRTAHGEDLPGSASAPMFESLPVYNRTDSSQPLLMPTAPAISDDDDQVASRPSRDAGRMASTQPSASAPPPSAPDLD
ncbi:uncharacterized protein PFL1_05391 [Pseudozyma flocculosa PF-1]|uniref:Transmembrane protein n=1 Tax=Pseudozyma flocculosa PF-1 TaxID=1277687 RepID=A0A061H413_9BASI|nr:uncharacterized protein PFL1_05391 [Pseudozyma flocculosa PF-1]EPQ27109.1 hypothetical protein PFL1_05391 [Pseudozyma flocculosa PF-1]